MLYRWIRTTHARRQEWLLKRNCALSPSQLGMAFGLLGVVSLVIAGVLAAHGAWLVLPFTLIELSALAIAFVVYGRHAADFERIVVDSGRLLVERCDGQRVERSELRPAWVRVEYDGLGREPIRLVAGNDRIVVGKFVPDDGKRQLANELRATLADWRQGEGAAAWSSRQLTTET